MKSRFVCLARFCCVVFCVALLAQLQFSASLVLSDERVDGSEQVDFFTAINTGQIDVTLTQSNSLNGRVTIKNKTKKTLLLQLPSTFAGVPYNAQVDGTLPTDTATTTRTTGSGTTTGSTRNQNQTTGGGYGGGGYGGGGYGGGGYGGYGGGMMSLPPEKIVRHNIKTICLEYGKKEPRSNIKYRMKPLDSVTDKPEVGVLCSLIASGSVDQWSAQAAIWHFNNNMSWNEIASKRVKPRIDSMYTVPLFSPRQIDYAMTLCRQVELTVARQNSAYDKPAKSKNQIFKSDENSSKAGSFVNDLEPN
ncbi:MAG: hypothetical protein LBL62_11620 [Planctomycetaceae bacterium]|jgi:hypothetical protein|nr:hypothetical protein [Planctomycetaceae bacterium]